VELFKPRVTVARDAHSSSNGSSLAPPASAVPVPRNANDARAAFDSLFRKS